MDFSSMHEVLDSKHTAPIVQCTQKKSIIVIKNDNV